ncbi:MAG: hypothetical protein IOC35_10050 [Methylobacterium sp.]|nr:hypothetical protein [Methylobacterium sp.]
MTADELVYAVISALPSQKVDGKKRLQKMCFFAALRSGEANKLFRIHNFGPYSVRVDQASEVLSIFGVLKAKDIAVGASQTYVRSYSLGEAESNLSKFSAADAKLIAELDKYSTIELEVASTVAFYKSIEGYEFAQALDATKRLKPTKVNPSTTKKSQAILDFIGA